jgi:tetratricopeptide (TPR) repeat protein
MHFERARTLFEQVGNLQRVAMMDLNLGEVYRYKGDFTRARHLYRKAYEVASKLHLIELRTLALANEGQMLLNMDRYDQAAASLQDAYQLTMQWSADSEQAVENTRTEIHCALSEICLHRSAFTAAWEHAQHALENAEASQLPILVGVANRVIADVLSTAAELPNVNRSSFTADPDLYYQRAITILRDIRAEAELAHTMFAYGKSLAKRGRQLNAARQLQQAMIVYTRLDMVAHAAKAARAQLDVTA